VIGPVGDIGMRRLTVAGLMGGVGVVAAGLAAVRLASPLALDLVAGAILLALAVGLLGMVVAAEPRAGWRGFALFGWGYFLYVALPWPTMGGLHVVPTERAVQSLVDSLLPHPALPARPAFPSPYDPGQYLDNNGLVVLKWNSMTGNTTPLTPAEVKAWNAYKAATEAQTARIQALSEQAQVSSRVCHLEIAFVFALFGWGAGRYLARQRPATAPAEASNRIHDQ
jgi:hypothetical protein